MVNHLDIKSQLPKYKNMRLKKKDAHNHDEENCCTPEHRSDIIAYLISNYQMVTSVC